MKGKRERERGRHSQGEGEEEREIRTARGSAEKRDKACASVAVYSHLTSGFTPQLKKKLRYFQRELPGIT